jgi:hypothetical protein
VINVAVPFFCINGCNNDGDPITNFDSSKVGDWIAIIVTAINTEEWHCHVDHVGETSNHITCHSSVLMAVTMMAIQSPTLTAVGWFNLISRLVAFNCREGN